MMHPTWPQAIRQTRSRYLFLTTLFLLLACALAAPHLFAYIEKRQGITLSDWLLDYLTPRDFSKLIFSLLYGLIGLGIVLLAQSPILFLTGLQAYLLITLARFTTLLLVPLEPPAALQPLEDPFVFELFYRQPVTKDLFFSGHAATMFLLFFLYRKSLLWKSVFLVGSLVISYLVLVQHAHYTIDVIAAPVFAWLAHRLALRFGNRYYAPE